MGLIRYHIPRTWVQPGENLLVLHEELGGDPSKISFLTKTGQEICTHVSEADPPPADSWKPDLGFSPGVCHANILSLAQQACIGQEGCSIPVSTTNLGDPCPGLTKSFAIEALCSA